MSDYEESLSYVKESADSLFPEFLFKPVFNDFGDDYYEKSFVQNGVQLEAKKLRRRYNDFFQWQNALSIYYNYMQTLVNKWGSLKTIKNSVEEGSMPDFVPSKPKLKNTKKNRYYLRTGNIPAQRSVDLVIPDEDIIAIARQLYPNDKTDEEIIVDNYKPTKQELKAYDAVIDKSERQNRRQNMYRNVTSTRGTDFIVEYLAQSKRGIYNSSGSKKSKDDTMGVADLLKEYLHRQNTPQWKLDDEEATETTYSGGRIVKRRDLEQTEVYKILYEEGFNIIETISGVMNKRSVKMIRSQIGATEPMTKKEMKKLKKRNKKDQEKLQRKRDADDAMSDLLLHNKIKDHFSRDDNGDLVARFDDLYPRLKHD